MLEQNITAISLILVPRLNSNGDNVHYYNPENVQLTRNSTKAPILINSDTDFGDRSIFGKNLVKNMPDGGVNYLFNLKIGHE